MKRDLDLLRKILLAVENADGFYSYNGVDQVASAVGYSDLSIISFHISLLVDSDYIEVTEVTCCGQAYDDYLIKRLTAAGCDYLDSVRNDSIWDATKATIAKAEGSCALSLVKSIAEKVILSQIGM